MPHAPSSGATLRVGPPYRGRACGTPGACLPARTPGPVGLVHPADGERGEPAVWGLHDDVQFLRVSRQCLEPRVSLDAHTAVRPTPFLPRYPPFKIWLPPN